MLAVTREQIVRFRARAMHLASRLPPGSLAEAAWGGLQDSAPRTALLSLHTRVAGVDPDSWQDPSLVQIWGPRMAVYVVPRNDVDVFTLGRLPRDEVKRAQIESVAAAIVNALDGRERSGRDLAAALPDVSSVALRVAGPSGKVLIRWDARTTSVLPAEERRMDPEDARLELARRYLHWLGPGTHSTFASWAGVEPRDAKQTWSSLEPELLPVEGSKAAILADDGAAFSAEEPVSGVRLVPPGDPFLATARATLVPDDRARTMLWPRPKDYPRLPSGKPFIPGAILLDGEIVGIWGRVGARVTLVPWEDVKPSRRDRIARAGEEMGGPLGAPVDVRWIGSDALNS